MKTTTALCSSALVLLSSVTVPSAHYPSTEPQESIRVVVQTSATPLRAVQGARVLILADDGTELAASTTDARGTAFLRYRRGGERPRFVLVEAIDCYISGLRWDPRVTEYYILVTGRAAL
jgi:uncharacterized protein YfaS (alpha-2-macroglobulin family)